MMQAPGEAAAVVEAAYTALANDGLDAFIGYWAHDVDHRSVEGAPDDFGPIHGRDAFRRYVEDWIDTFDGFAIAPIELTEFGAGQVAGVLRFGGRAKLSRVKTDQTFGVIFTVRGGKITRGREFATREDALRAAGLSQ